jgi:hypothetical protein
VTDLKGRHCERSEAIQQDKEALLSLRTQWSDPARQRSIAVIANAVKRSSETKMHFV